MITNIWLGKGYRNIKPTDIVGTTRAVHSFCIYNSLRDCLFKSQGGYYILRKDGHLEFFTSALNQISFQDLYDKLKTI